MKKLFLMAVLGIMVMGINAHAGLDDGMLSGFVVDSETGEAIADALVFVRICDVGLNDGTGEGSGSGMHGQHIYSDTTDENGAFFIDSIPAGEWVAKARKRAAGNDEEIVLIEAGYETVVTFELVPCTGNLNVQLRYHGGE